MDKCVNYTKGIFGSKQLRINNSVFIHPRQNHSPSDVRNPEIINQDAL